jgi:hypothetical protein
MKFLSSPQRLRKAFCEFSPNKTTAKTDRRSFLISSNYMQLEGNSYNLILKPPVVVEFFPLQPSYEEEMRRSSNENNPNIFVLAPNPGSPEQKPSLFSSRRKYLVIGIAIFIIATMFYARESISNVLYAFVNWVEDFEEMGWWAQGIAFVLFVLLFLLISFPIILGGYIPLTLGKRFIYD